MIRGRCLRVAAALSAAAVLGACGTSAPPTPFPSPVVYTTRAAATATALQPAAEPTAIPSPTQPAGTPDPYAGLTIADLAAREYGGGQLEFEFDRPANSFDRYIFHYPSDGLTVYGFMNLPHGDGPHPVVLVLHGYLDPAEYDIYPYTTRYADSLAAAGYVVLHPNFRNYPPSDPGPNLFRVGYAVDVMNLIALIQQQAGTPGPLASADGQAIGLFGHSMGGGIALRTLTVGAPVQAAVVYGSMSADEQRNFEGIFAWSEGQRGLEELQVPEGDLQRISPVYYLERIQAPLSVHHGEEDELVPPEWSESLCQQLMTLGKTVECYSYPDELHTFVGFGGIELMERSVAFFERYLGAP